MKSRELHRLIRDAGWEVLRQNGSHIIYRKDGMTMVVPYHGAKEVRPGLAAKIEHTIKLAEQWKKSVY